VKLILLIIFAGASAKFSSAPRVCFPVHLALLGAGHVEQNWVRTIINRKFNLLLQTPGAVWR